MAQSIAQRQNMIFPFSYINHNFIESHQASISPDDRSFLFGVGVYESIAIEKGIPFLLPRHINRLIKNLALLNIPNPYSHQKWMSLVEALIEHNQAIKAKCYLQVTDGAAVERHHANSGEPNVYIKLYPWETQPNNFNVITVKDERWALPHVKSTSLLANTLAAKKAKLEGCCEAVFVDSDLLAHECSSSNFFIVKNNIVVTPPANNKLVNGITRQVVLELCHSNHISYREESISKNDLFEADEMFITSTYRKVHPIHQIDNQSINQGNTGPITNKIMSLYNHYKMEQHLCITNS